MTRGSPRTDLHAVGAPPDHDARALAWLSAVLVVAALGLGAALVVAGEAWPSAGAVAVFALLAWFAVNRYTFFPSELAVTSESAVLLAAVVAFHRDAPLLGPWCVAALLGPLDAVHWEHRAFSRMGFNAAHQMLAVVAASAAYAGIAERSAHGVPAMWLGAGVAVVAYALVVWALGIVALRVWSRLHVVDAVRQLLPLDWIVVPLGVLGACAGIAATTRGWWALPLVLVPVAFVPELVLGHARSLAYAFVGSRRVRAVVVVVAGALLLAPVAVALGDGACAALGLLVLGGLAAVELLGPRRALVPPLAGAVVAVGAAVVGLGVPWWSPTRTIGALGAGVLVAGAAALTAPSGARAAEVARVAWALPLFAVGITAALVVVRVGPGAAALPVVLVVACATLVVAWASPPWSSAVLVPALVAHRFAARRLALAVLVVVALVAGTAATRAHHASGLFRTCCTLAALAALEVALAVASVGARQWRFDPRRRRLVVAAVVATSVAALAGLPLLARHAPAWVALAVVVVAAIVSLVGEEPSRLGDEAAHAADDGPEPTRRERR